MHNPLNTLKSLQNDNKRFYYALPSLESQGFPNLRRLPVSIRIMLESLLRHCDGKVVKESDVRALASWNAKKPQDLDIPFIVSRVILQDFTGVPLVVDLAAMRDAVAAKKLPPQKVEPLVPVDLVVDHSVQVDLAGSKEAFLYNLKLEFDRNRERYAFLKWGQQAFKTFQVVPPGIGIVHQVNLEYIATVVTASTVDGKTLLYPDTLVGTDSHTTMINGLGVLGWGVGGIEAEAAMLGQPAFLQMPEVIGVHLSGRLKSGVTATDLTLRITEMLRKEKVVGKFIEYFGEGAASLTVADRATIANMAPEYGATIGFFAVDEKTLDYLKMTGRSSEHIALVKEYLQAQQLFGIPKKGDIDCSKILELDLSSIQPCVAGPKRPQDRIDLPDLKAKFKELLTAPLAAGGYGKAADQPAPRICIREGDAFPLTLHMSGGTAILNGEASWSEAEMVTNRPITETIPSKNEHKSRGETCDIVLTDGSIVIAAITSCTNTSNPHVMLAAGLLAKKAVERGLKVNENIKTSLAPGSRVVTDYLEKTGLQQYLNALGFDLVAYGCTTCIGNSGPLDEHLEKAIKEHNLIAASVLSGNRNFEARIHGAVKANFLMSPPLVVAFALAGRVDIDLDREPLGHDAKGAPVFLRDLWPSPHEIEEAMVSGVKPEMFKKRYAVVHEDSPVWKEIDPLTGPQFPWDPKSSYIQRPPYFEMVMTRQFANLRPLALFGDSVTTDHISPAGAFRADSPAGQYLLELGVKEKDFNSYGSRRGNHHVMMRGTFANIRLRNKMADGQEGGFTKQMPEGTLMTIFEASQRYAERNQPLIVIAGKDYGMGSSRDWAAKGTALLGVKLVLAQSFERIHRSNLIQMGVLPLQFMGEESLETLKLEGDETYSLVDFSSKPKQVLTLEIEKNGQKRHIKVLSRLDTQSEVEYFEAGGILPFVLKQTVEGK